MEINNGLDSWIIEKLYIFIFYQSLLEFISIWFLVNPTCMHSFNINLLKFVTFKFIHCITIIFNCSIILKWVFLKEFAVKIARHWFKLSYLILLISKEDLNILKLFSFVKPCINVVFEPWVLNKFAEFRNKLKEWILNVYLWKQEKDFVNNVIVS